MKTTALFLPVLLALGAGLSARPVSSGTPIPHCQVPCGVYGDSMRIDMLMEDCATIEKGMTQILSMEAGKDRSENQMVRWVMTKDQHAAAIQERVASYWLAQRIKAPADAKGRESYLRQLELMHGITVAAMKCKQTTDVAHVASIRKLAMQFSTTYFGPEDLEHIQEHQGGEHK